MLVEALVCLALNVYHEARDQPFIGQVAVAQVVMNRVHDDRFPNTVCEVVQEGPTYCGNLTFQYVTAVNSVGIVMASQTVRIMKRRGVQNDDCTWCILRQSR